MKRVRSPALHLVTAPHPWQIAKTSASEEPAGSIGQTAHSVSSIRGKQMHVRRPNVFKRMHTLWILGMNVTHDLTKLHNVVVWGTEVVVFSLFFRRWRCLVEDFFSRTTRWLHKPSILSFRDSFEIVPAASFTSDKCKAGELPTIVLNKPIHSNTVIAKPTRSIIVVCARSTHCSINT